MNPNIFAKANQIIKTCGIAAIAVIDEEGFPSASMVTAIKQENIFEAYFATGINANKTKRLLRDKRASVCYHSSGTNITLVGEAEIVTDQETKSHCWIDGFIEHFPLGETDPNYCIIKFTTKRVSLWIDNESAEFTIDELITVQSRCGLLCKWCTYKKSHGCRGCIALQGKPFWGECPVAACCQDKGYTNCGECNDIPCDILNDFSCGEGEDCDKPKGARITVCKMWNRVSSTCSCEKNQILKRRYIPFSDKFGII